MQLVTIESKNFPIKKAPILSVFEIALLFGQEIRRFFDPFSPTFGFSISKKQSPPSCNTLDGVCWLAASCNCLPTSRGKGLGCTGVSWWGGKNLHHRNTQDKFLRHRRQKTLTGSVVNLNHGLQGFGGSQKQPFHPPKN